MKHYSEVIKKLNLTPLPEEGGFYKETYRSNRTVTSKELGMKTESTAIYYLITEESFSALHTVDQDEIFHFYAGSPVEMFQIDKNGIGSHIIIGSDFFNGETPQVIVPHGVWQGTKLKNPTPGAWALLGCTVAPGFEFQNFHIKTRDDLIMTFPHLRDEIIKYTN
jgi:predicted cupin superfamily sugar epimerase